MSIVVKVMLIIGFCAFWAWSFGQLFPDASPRPLKEPVYQTPAAPRSGGGGYFGRIDAGAE